MKLKALDNFHATALGQDIVRRGQEFEAHDALGQDLIDKGLAERTGEKAEAALPNKAEPELSNKARRRRDKAEAAQQPFPEPEPDED